MTNLARFENNGLELVINTQTGEAFATVRAAAKAIGKSEPIVRLFIASQGWQLKTAKIETQSVRLLNERQILEVIEKYNPNLLSVFAQLGLRTYLHNLVGYGYQTMFTALQTKCPQSYVQALEALVKSEKEKELIMAQKKLIEEQNKKLSEAIDELFSYSSIVRIAKFNRCSQGNFKWQVLKAQSRNMGIEIKQVPCPKSGYKNLYHHDVWRCCYPRFEVPETMTLRIEPRWGVFNNYDDDYEDIEFG